MDDVIDVFFRGEDSFVCFIKLYRLSFLRTPQVQIWHESKYVD